MKISVETTVKSSIANVWSCWTTPEDINQWNAASPDWHNPHSVNDFRIGGHFLYRMEAKDGSMGFDFAGTYTNIIEGTLIEYVFGVERNVSICFVPVADGIKIIESFDTEDEHSVEQQRQGWQSILNNFKTYTEAKIPQA